MGANATPAPDTPRDVVGPVPVLLPRDSAKEPRRGDVVQARNGTRRVVVVATETHVTYVTISKRAPKSTVSRRIWASWCRRMNAVYKQQGA